MDKNREKSRTWTLKRVDHRGTNLVVVVMAVKERLLAKDHAGKHAAEAPHVQGVVIYLHTYRHTYIHTFTQTCSPDSTCPGSSHTSTQTYRHTYMHTFTQTCSRGSTCPASSHTSTQTYRHTYRHTYMHTYTHKYHSNTTTPPS